MFAKGIENNIINLDNVVEIYVHGKNIMADTINDNEICLQEYASVEDAEMAMKAMMDSGVFKPMLYFRGE